MSRIIFGIAGCILGNLRQRLCHFLILGMETVSMRNLEFGFDGLRILACIVPIASLPSWTLKKLIAAEAAEIEALLELEPLDWSSIDSPKVIEECTRALANKSKLKENQICQLYFTRGIALNFVGKHENAVRDLTEVLNRHPNDCRSLRFRGQIYDILKQHDKAHADYEAIIRHHPDSGIGYACLALSFGEMGDNDSFRKFAEKAVTLDPEEPKGHFARSIAHLKEHEQKEALKELNQCIALSYGGGTSASAHPFQLRAAVYMFIDNPKKAFPDLQMASLLDYSGDTTKGMFCNYYFKMGKYNMAFRISEEFMRKQPHRVDFLHMRAYCLLERKRHEEAQEIAESMVRQEPRQWRSYLCRGQLFFAQKKYMEALQDYDKSLILHRGHLGAIASKAYLLAACPEAQFRDGPTARTLATRCCERTEYQIPRQLMLLAMASAECGDYKEAVRLAKKSVEKADSSFPYLTEYKRRLALFEEGKPYRFVPGSRTFDYLFP